MLIQGVIQNKFTLSRMLASSSFMRSYVKRALESMCLKSEYFENSTPCVRIVRSALTLDVFPPYLKYHTSYELNVMDFFAPYDLRINLICFALLEHLSNADPCITFDPCSDPLCSVHLMELSVHHRDVVYGP